MAPDTAVQAVALAKATNTIARTYKKSVAVIACIPHTHLAGVSKAVKALSLGAQSVAPVTTVASTGMISAAMVKAAGATYSLVGHSESRAYGDTNEIVKEQLNRLLEKKLVPILCVGEKERDAHGWYLSVIKDQLESALQDVPKATLKRTVIAYEPVWAIGVNATREATPVECREMVIFIHKIIADLYDEKTSKSIPVLYGGSVDESNAGTFVREGGADGLLVGRVSLEPKRFVKIAESISKIEK